MEKINECEQESEDLKYDLIYLDEDDIPELVVGEPGYYVSLYMYDAGTLYTVLDRWPYGAMGNGGYEYYPKTNIISNYNSDFGGNATHITYYKINEDFQDELYYGLSIWTFDPEGQYSDEDDFENETYYYYYNDQEITKEEFDSYLINDDYDSIVGSKTASEISSQLQTQEKITQ